MEQKSVVIHCLCDCRSYDEGERFDLRSPYADDGWVDPDEVDAFAGEEGLL